MSIDTPKPTGPQENTLDTAVRKSERISFPLWVKLALGGLAASTVFGGAVVGYQAKKAVEFTDGLNDALNNPTAAAPAVAGEKRQKLLNDAGIKLSGDEIKSFYSSERNHLLDEVFLPKLQDALNNPEQLAQFTEDPGVLNQLENLSRAAFSNVPGENKFITICGTVASDEVHGDESGTCYGNPSRLDDDIALTVVTSSSEHIFGVAAIYTLPGTQIALSDTDKLVMQR